MQFDCVVVVYLEEKAHIDLLKVLKLCLNLQSTMEEKKVSNLCNKYKKGSRFFGLISIKGGKCTERERVRDIYNNSRGWFLSRSPF